MRKIRVLVVDDSTVIRRLLSDTLNSDPALEVAATAPNGRIALAKIPQINPDVVTLDMEMPEMDGIATLVELRKTYPRLPVIMFSTLTQRGAMETLDALAKGASDYVTKPANVGSVTAALQNVKNDLIPKIKGFCSWSQPTAAVTPAARILANTARNPTVPRTSRTDIVAIGVSTGGPNALATVIGKLPVNFPVPVVVVQHMPPVFTKHLANRLDQLSPLDVKEAEPGDVLYAGGVWIAPGDFHLTLHRQGTTISLETNQNSPENSCRPAVDVLFRSVAELYGKSALAVVLTGMGQDGLRGCQAIHDGGGKVIVQDEASSVVWGMPGAVSNAGLAAQTVSLDRMADEILCEAHRNRNAYLLAHTCG
jgi:two-component system chemotaxis response regulator CheB